MTPWPETHLPLRVVEASKQLHRSGGDGGSSTSGGGRTQVQVVLLLLLLLLPHLEECAARCLLLPVVATALLVVPLLVVVLLLLKAIGRMLGMRLLRGSMLLGRPRSLAGLLRVANGGRTLVPARVMLLLVVVLLLLKAIGRMLGMRLLRGSVLLGRPCSLAGLLRVADGGRTLLAARVMLLPLILVTAGRRGRGCAMAPATRPRWARGTLLVVRGLVRPVWLGGLLPHAVLVVRVAGSNSGTGCPQSAVLLLRTRRPRRTSCRRTRASAAPTGRC